MRAWGKVYYEQKQRPKEAIVNAGIDKRDELPLDIEFMLSFIGELSDKLDIERPQLANKHVRELFLFGRTSFLPADFIESVIFNKFTVELISQ